MKTNDPIANLPGGLLVLEGLADFRSGRCTIPACLVAIAKSRLTGAGLIADAANGQFPDPERQLYGLLRQEKGDAYSRYNALLRELISFEQALDRRRAEL